MRPEVNRRTRAGDDRVNHSAAETTARIDHIDRRVSGWSRQTNRPEGVERQVHLVQAVILQYQPSVRALGSPGPRATAMWLPGWPHPDA
jgi:hypothetical protein